MALGKRAVSILVVLLLVATNLNAQHRWDGKEKHWYRDWLWWIGEGVIAGAFAADAHSTSLVRDRCPACRETNPLLGPHPSNRAITVDSGILFGVYTALHIGSYVWCPDVNGDSKPWRLACYTAVPAIVAPLKIRAAILNYNLAARSGSQSTQSFSTSTFARGQSISGRLTDTGTRPWIAQRYGKPVLLSKQFSDCRNLLVLCTPIPTATEPKVDLRSVQLR